VPRCGILFRMARGWESKAVEAQQEMRDLLRKRSPAPPSAGERARLERRRTLELALARTRADLDASSSPAHRRMLEQALRDLEVAWART